MTPVRTKDKLFLAVAVPLVLVAAYMGLWRRDAARAVSELDARLAGLVEAADFPFEERKLKEGLRRAEEARAAAEALPPVRAAVRADAAARPAEREREVIAVLREAGLAVMRSERAAEMRGETAGAAVLRATGTRPEPVLRRYLLDGGYPAVRRALGAFAAREMAVVVETVAMRADGKWEVTVDE